MSLISLIRPRPLPYGGKAISGASPRTTVPQNGTEFASQLKDLSEGVEESLRVAVNPRSGQIELLNEGARPAAGNKILPLKHKALPVALDTIEEGNPWLMGGEPIFKVEGNGNARIDFLNRGGYVFNQQGEEISRSVNPW